MDNIEQGPVSAGEPGKPVDAKEVPARSKVRVIVCDAENLSSGELSTLADWIKGELER